MDFIFIKKLKVQTIIGIYKWERLTPQFLQLDLKLGVNNKQAAKTDDISLTLDYSVIAKRIKLFALESNFLLIETFAEYLAELLIIEYNLNWIKLKVTKLNAILEASSTGIEIERTKKQQP